MSHRVHAVYDGEVLRPESPVDLKPNTRYLLVVEKEDANSEILADTPYPLSIIRSFATDMKVTDLSTRHDYFTHGRNQ
jgi:predicted DNA-binding antitoxin AbrB/MazE fold protein